MPSVSFSNSHSSCKNHYHYHFISFHHCVMPCCVSPLSSFSCIILKFSLHPLGSIMLQNAMQNAIWQPYRTMPTCDHNFVQWSLAGLCKSTFVLSSSREQATHFHAKHSYLPASMGLFVPVFSGSLHRNAYTRTYCAHRVLLTPQNL